MGLFWVGAAAMIAIALFLVLRPLLAPRPAAAVDRKATNVDAFRERLAELERSRDDGALSPDEFAAARTELERSLIADADRDAVDRGRAPAADPVTAIVIALAVPTIAFGLYLQLGAPDALRPAPPPTVAPGGGPSPHEVQDMVSRLEARLAEEPGNVEGWLLLARTYTTLARYPDARGAFARAHDLAPEEPAIMLALAAATARVAGNDLRGEPEALIEQALAIAPESAFGLWLGGYAATQRGDTATALTRWKRLRASGQVEGPELAQLDRNIAELEGAAPPRPPAADAAAGGRRVSVTVSLAPELAGRAAPTDTVFVFARAANGPRAPLAVIRRLASDLPLSVTLDDSMAMQPGLELSRFTEIVVAARVSRSGNAAPASGDLRGSSRATLSDGEPVTIRIDEVVP